MAIFYYIFLKPLSYLPDWFIHRLSDMVFLIVYYLIPYRKGLVIDNIRRSFPEKTETQVKSISKKFYRQFCDTMLEMLKAFSLTEKEAQNRIIVTNPELLDSYHAQGKSVLISGGHYANWEALTLTAVRSKHDLYGLYTPINNKFFEKKVTESRSRFGFNMISTKKYKEALTEDYKNPRAFVFAVDQSPRKGSGHWMTFLNQETAVLFGTEKTAKEFDLPIISGHMKPVGRGRYELTYNVLFDEPKPTQEGEITETCMRDLEKLIISAPEYWLWTHRRWKHKRTNA